MSEPGEWRSVDFEADWKRVEAVLLAKAAQYQERWTRQCRERDADQQVLWSIAAGTCDLSSGELQSWAAALAEKDRRPEPRGIMADELARLRTVAQAFVDSTNPYHDEDDTRFWKAEFIEALTGRRMHDDNGFPLPEE